MATMTTNRADRNFVMRTLVPRLLRELQSFEAEADALLSSPAYSGITVLCTGQPYTSFTAWREALVAALEAYEPELTQTGYDKAWGRLRSWAESYGQWFQGFMHRISGLEGPDRYSEALATIRRLPGEADSPAIALLSALRGVDDMPAILEMIHDYATSQGYLDWRVATPDNPDDFYSRRYTAGTYYDGQPVGQVWVFATGAPESRLVWRVYDDPDGRSYKGILASPSCEGYRPVRDPERGGYVVGEHRLGCERLPHLDIRVDTVQDISTPCSKEAFAVLCTAVSRVWSKYADGHLSEAEAWNDAVVLPAIMVGIRVNRSDLRRALTARGWVCRDHARGYWYYEGSIQD